MLKVDCTGSDGVGRSMKHLWEAVGKKTGKRGNDSHVDKQPIMASLANSKKGHDWLLGNVGIIPT